MLAALFLAALLLPAAAAAVNKPISSDDIDFVSKEVGFAVGTPGSLYATTDGGVTWSRRPLGTTDWLTGVDFVSAKRGWVLGVVNEGEPARIWYTQDGGRHWAVQSNPTSCDILTDVAFVSRLKGVIVGRYGTVLRTTNGGGAWKKQESGTTAFFHAVDFVTARRGYVAGEKSRPPGSDPYAFGVIRRTVSGGAVWLKSF